MQTNTSDTLLRRVLLLDAMSSGALALVGIALAAPLAALLGLPADLLREAGIVLIPFAAFVGFVASRARMPRAAVWIIIGLNVLWTIDSIALVFSDAITPNAFGYAFILGQAAAVGVLAELEYFGLRRTRRVAG